MSAKIKKTRSKIHVNLAVANKTACRKIL